MCSSLRDADSADPLESVAVAATAGVLAIGHLQRWRPVEAMP